MTKRKYVEGSIFNSTKYGPFEIVEYVNGKKILIRFLQTGYEYWTSNSKIVGDGVRDKSTSRVFGVGILDVDYIVEQWNGGNRIVCPYYRVWKNMLQRCYHKPKGSYAGCYVFDGWHRLSEFKLWMEQQDWEGNHLDKDLLVIGNKMYGPETCVFISADLNYFISGNTLDGELPKGYYKRGSKFIAQGGLDRSYLGTFNSPEEAHEAWKSNKKKLAEGFLDDISDERIKSALIERYS